MVIASAVLSLALAQAPALAPQYACRGQDPDGSAYTATLETKPHGPLWLLRWHVGTAWVYGVGIVDGDRLAVAFRDDSGAFTGIVVYRVTLGELRGRWTAFGVQDVYPESCLAGDDRAVA